MSDRDSLFGSPPPSPSARGRSPSLALPELPASYGEASTQNVGTIALPGSHEICSELPVFLHPALPSEDSSASSPRPPPNNAPSRPPSPRRKRSRGKTLRPPRPQSRPHPLTPHGPQTDRTLRYLVDLISHFEPGAHVPAQRSSHLVEPEPVKSPNSGDAQHPIGSAQNPIDIEDYDKRRSIYIPSPVAPRRHADTVNNAVAALVRIALGAMKLPSSQNPVQPLQKLSVETVLQAMKQDPKLIPVLQSTQVYLARLNSRPSQPQASFPFTMNDTGPSSMRMRPAMKKACEVPAGAGHWDVPFPFAPGEGPEDYSSQWQLGRGRRVLGDLLGLFERAFARVKNEASMSAVTIPKATKQRMLKHSGSVIQITGSDFDGSIDGTSICASPVPSLLTPSSLTPAATPVDDEEFTFDFERAFNSECLADTLPWQSFGEQSINGLHIHGDFMSQSSVPNSQLGSPHLQPLAFDVDPLLLMLGKTHVSACASSSSALDGTSPGQEPSIDFGFFSAEPNAQAQSNIHSHSELNVVDETLDIAESGHASGIDHSGSVVTAMPTALSSHILSQNNSPGPTDENIPSIASSARSIQYSRAQRKEALLAKARRCRARLIEAIEEAAIGRWETVVEGGVLRNLQISDVV